MHSMNSKLLIIVLSFTAILSAGMLGYLMLQQDQTSDDTNAVEQTGGKQPDDDQADVHIPLVHPYGEVAVHVGETVLFPDLQFKVVSIVQESRCPSDVQCIVAGTLFVEIETVSGMGKSTQKLELGSLMTTEAEQITFKAASPYPVSGAHIPESAYLLTFAVSPQTGTDNSSAPVAKDTIGTSAEGACYVGGCSAQICSDTPDMVSTCEYRETYACYQQAICERQSSGMCGWTPTAELNACLSQSS